MQEITPREEVLRILHESQRFMTVMEVFNRSGLRAPSVVRRELIHLEVLGKAERARTYGEQGGYDVWRHRKEAENSE